MSRKLQKKDLQFIERLRNTIRQQSQLSTTTPETQSVFGDSCFDEFHSQILKHSRIASIKIATSHVLPKSESAKPHTLYNIEVVTDSVNYQVSRRYREFYDLYKKIKKFLPFSCLFPRKNYNPFVSSTSQTIVQQRIAKLNAFLQEVFQFIVSERQPVVTTCFFNFIQLKQTYENQYISVKEYKNSLNQYKKTSSENKPIERYYTMKSSLSEKNITVFGQNSMEMNIALINDRQNPGKNLSKLEEFVKNRRQKATNQEIKLMLIGFDQYLGVLQFGLTNFLQANRIAALQILVDLMMPESNMLYDKYEKVLQKLPLQMWVVDDISYFDNSIFKVLYFKLLSIYCERAGKEQNKSEVTILKSLFLFHQSLMNDYFQYRKINTREQFNPLFTQHTLRETVQVDLTDKIQISQFQDDQKNIQVLNFDGGKVQGFYYKAKNTLILKFKSLKSVEQIQQISFKWNRLIQSYSLEDYTGLYKYSLCSHHKKWNLRLKIAMDNRTGTQLASWTSHLIPHQVQESIKECIEKSRLKISKSQYPFEICPEYEEEIWVQQLQHENKVLIAVKVARDIDIFEGSLRRWADRLCHDALTHF